MEESLDRDDLAKFDNTERLHEFSTLTPNVLLTDGAKYVADHGGAYWLMDIIAQNQMLNEDYLVESFQHWTLTVDNAFLGKVECEDGNNNIIFRKYIEYTAFPLRSIDLYAIHVKPRIIIMLPGEYS